MNCRNDSVNYILMHKNIRVAEMELNPEKGMIQRILKVLAPEHLPVGVTVKKGIPDRTSMNEWWEDRSIPLFRAGIKEAMERLEIQDPKALLMHCYGLSLMDQYWICSEGSGLEWKNIQFFHNDFSEDVGDVLFGIEKCNPLNFCSPDNTTNGNLKKRWKIIDGKRCLIKGGSNPYRQEPMNEVIAAELMKSLGIPRVPYHVIWSKGAPYSVCEDFIDENTELVPAWCIIQAQKQNNDVSLYTHFLNCAEKLGIPDAKEFLNRMIVADYLIANEDRHLNNFGAVRHAETLEWIGMAPIYDSGSSLGFDKNAALMRNESETLCKPFKKSHEEQLKLVSDFSWIDFDALADFPDLITRVLSDEAAGEYMESVRIRTIAELAAKRVERLKRMAGEKNRFYKAIPNLSTENGTNGSVLFMCSFLSM